MWERRYDAVVPFRSEAGTRLYTRSDVDRLILIKRLVDRGDAISMVANLPQEIRERRCGGAELPQSPSDVERACRVVVLGTTLPHALEGSSFEDSEVEMLGCFRDRENLIGQAGGLEPDLLVLESATIQPQQIRDIGALMLQVAAPRVLIVYGVAARSTLERLESPRVFPIRGPVDPAELRRWIRMLHARPTQAPQTFVDAQADLSGAPAPRRFDDATLARIAAAPSTIRCECQEHLVDLISRLTTFETYSEECEVLNVEDAAVHALLHASTARARSLLETSLAHLIEADGIAIDGDAQAAS